MDGAGNASAWTAGWSFIVLYTRLADLNWCTRLRGGQRLPTALQ
jgi:hypothetical protein